ncbi:MAG: GspE/PulE family protein [Proteobacteria bacterium]|nr:GspE/PulE family protein [Pseudomonadota bacterium]
MTTKTLPRGKLDLRQLIAWLQADHLITAADAQRLAARLGATASSLHPLTRLAGAGLVNLKGGEALDAPALTAWLAQRLGLPLVRIDPLRVDASRVAEVMSQAYAESRRALPLQYGPAEITIATCEPLDVGWVAEIEAHTRRRVLLALATPEDVARYTAEFYGLAQSVRTARRQQGDAAATAAPSFEQLVDLKGKDALDANDQGVVQVVDWLWQYAFEQRASDIHLEPRRDMGTIRLRIDGVLHAVHQVPAPVMAAMTARIKLLGRMDVVERRRPQDGRIKTRRPGGQGEVELRLSTLPTAFGEKVVMRIFDPGVVDQGYEALGFGELAATWRTLVGQPHGIVLVTGPTGSGKTTTLYATLKQLATSQVNVCTLEDPIEMIEPAFNQTQVQSQLDLGFAAGLRALMRQDPDIIMVGEIRDLETAEMAIQAALTGHLVLSTLHTNDAPAAITRLADLGVQPYLIGATVTGVLAQRLVRALCPDCKAPAPEAEGAARAAQLARPWQLPTGTVYQPVGCPACRGTGYKGRVALYEMMLLDEAARDAIHPRLDASALRRAAVASGLRPLRVAGLAQVLAGRTSLDEVLAATPRWEGQGATAPSASARRADAGPTAQEKSPAA